MHRVPRVMVITSDYPAFLASLYRCETLRRSSYANQIEARRQTLFGVAYFLVKSLQAEGWDAMEIYCNNPFLQRAWIREAHKKKKATTLLSLPSFFMQGDDGWIDTPNVPTVLPTRFLQDRLRSVLKSQIEHYRPDVILNHAPLSVGPLFWRKHRGVVPVLMTQIAAPLGSPSMFIPYDHVISSLPNMVEQFRASGTDASLQRLAFEPEVLTSVPSCVRDIEVSFVGNYTAHHERRAELLSKISEEVSISVWGEGWDQRLKRNGVKIHGAAWGLDMYSVLRRSRITLNSHISVADDYANNLRLFEATGMAALLLTDQKRNLSELFRPGEEVVTYETAEEAVAKIRSFLSSEKKRDAVATAGQRRTLTNHTYAARAPELMALMERLLAKAQSS